MAEQEAAEKIAAKIIPFSEWDGWAAKGKSGVKMRDDIVVAILAERSASDKRVEEALERAAKMIEAFREDRPETVASAGLRYTLSNMVRSLKFPANPKKE